MYSGAADGHPGWPTRMADMDEKMGRTGSMPRSISIDQTVNKLENLRIKLATLTTSSYGSTGLDR